VINYVRINGTTDGNRSNLRVYSNNDYILCIRKNIDRNEHLTIKSMTVKMKKKCSKCKKEKDIGAFGLCVANPDGRTYKCRQCRSDIYYATDMTLRI